MKRTAAFLFGCIIYLLTADAGYAAAIVNLDEKAHVFEIEYADGFRSVEIKAGESFRLIGRMKVRYNGREIRIEPFEEYALWKDGTFGIQKNTRPSYGG